MPVPVLLIHGAATTSHVWRKVRPFLQEADLEVYAPDRPCSGDMETEINFLSDLAQGTLIVGISGGATLGWELISRTGDPAGALLHEPAAGSLYPGLLKGPIQALEEKGPGSFGRALYGASWSEEELGEETETVTREVAMFSHFDPRPPHPQSGPVLLTVGECSPSPRHAVDSAYRRRFGTNSSILPMSSHAVHLDNPHVFAHAIITLAARLPTR